MASPFGYDGDAVERLGGGHRVQTGSIAVIGDVSEPGNLTRTRYTTLGT
jgi:hypothetical protein